MAVSYLLFSLPLFSFLTRTSEKDLQALLQTGTLDRLTPTDNFLPQLKKENTFKINCNSSIFKLEIIMNFLMNRKISQKRWLKWMNSTNTNPLIFKIKVGMADSKNCISKIANLGMIHMRNQKVIIIQILLWIKETLNLEIVT